MEKMEMINLLGEVEQYIAGLERDGKITLEVAEELSQSIRTLTQTIYMVWVFFILYGIKVIDEDTRG